MKKLVEEELQELTECEELVMKTIWENEEVLSIRDIMAQVNQKYNKEWKTQTVSTFLAKLIKKGYLNKERKGRHFFYYILIPEEKYVKKKITKCVDLWCKGKIENLIMAISKVRGIPKDDKEEILRFLRSMV